MQASVHLQLLVGAVGMERKMNSSVGLGWRWRHKWVGREYLKTTLSKPRGKLDTNTYRDWHERVHSNFRGLRPHGNASSQFRIINIS